MTDSSSLPPWMTGSELPQPDDEAGIKRTFDGYRAALKTMTIPELMELADRQAALLQAQQNDMMRRSLSPSPLDSTSNLDSPVLRTTPSRSMPAPSPRGRAAQASPPSPPPTSLDLLFGSRGRRLAAKLVAANARSIAGRRVR